MANPGEGPGGNGPPLFLDQNEAPRPEKIFFETGPQGLDDPSPLPLPPLSDGLDPPLNLVQKVITGNSNFRKKEKLLDLFVNGIGALRYG